MVVNVKRLFLCFLLLITLLTYMLFFYKPYLIQDKEDLITVHLVYSDKRESFELESYSRVSDLMVLIDLGDDVDHQKINPSKILSHNDVFNVPIITETPCVSLNSSSLEDLVKVKGIGPKTAQAIIDYREDQGFFKNIEEVMEIKGIGLKKYEDMVNMLCL